jgi:Cu-Zn family superoxide dismutase
LFRRHARQIFKQDEIYGEIVVDNYRDGVKVKAHFTKLPPGKHGFHIHKAGDLRGEGCHGLCEHYDIGKNSHGGSPEHSGERHTGDLGNIELKNGVFKKEYYIKGISVKDLWGRSIIVHEDEDDLDEKNDLDVNEEDDLDADLNDADIVMPKTFDPFDDDDDDDDDF